MQWYLLEKVAFNLFTPWIHTSDTLHILTNCFQVSERLHGGPEVLGNYTSSLPHNHRKMNCYRGCNEKLTTSLVPHKKYSLRLLYATIFYLGHIDKLHNVMLRICIYRGAQLEPVDLDVTSTCHVLYWIGSGEYPQSTSSSKKVNWENCHII